MKHVVVMLVIISLACLATLFLLEHWQVQFEYTQPPPVCNSTCLAELTQRIDLLEALVNRMLQEQVR